MKILSLRTDLSNVDRRTDMKTTAVALRNYFAGQPKTASSSFYPHFQPRV